MSATTCYVFLDVSNVCYFSVAWDVGYPSAYYTYVFDSVCMYSAYDPLTEAVYTYDDRCSRPYRVVCELPVPDVSEWTVLRDSEYFV